MAMIDEMRTESALERKLVEEITSSVGWITNRLNGFSVTVKVSHQYKTVKINVSYSFKERYNSDLRTYFFCLENRLCAEILQGLYFTFNNYFIPDNQYMLEIRTPDMSHTFARVVYDRDIYPVIQKYQDKDLNPAKYGYK